MCIAPPVPAYFTSVPSYYDFLCMTVAAAFLISKCTTEKNIWSYLVVGEDQRIGQNDILPPSSSEDDHFGDILWCEGFATTMPISNATTGRE